MEVKQLRIRIKCELPVGKIINHPRRGGGGLNIEGRLIRGGAGAHLRGGLNGRFTEVMKKISKKFH